MPRWVLVSFCPQTRTRRATSLSWMRWILPSWLFPVVQVPHCDPAMKENRPFCTFVTGIPLLRKKRCAGRPKNGDSKLSSSVERTSSSSASNLLASNSKESKKDDEVSLTSSSSSKESWPHGSGQDSSEGSLSDN
jgi:hypothetical protein